jgi:hypothetical protein
VAQAAVGQVEPRLGTAITRANLWLAQAPGHTEQCVWDVIVLPAIAMETGRRFMAASLRRGADHGEPSLEAGVELAERGARRAVILKIFAPAQRSLAGSPRVTVDTFEDGTTAVSPFCDAR